VFWASVAIIGYVYIGYPFAMWLLARRTPPQRLHIAANWPSVTLIIAAFNEEDAIAEKLANSLILNYPAEKMEIIVASDGSTDGTDRIVAGFQSRGVSLVRIEGRQGKTAVQNAAAVKAAGEILVFSDANALYAQDALRQLVQHFASEDIGCVEGRRLDFAPNASATARHELMYRDMESRIKTWESRVLSCTGATGPIYAVRRSLYVPLQPALISDLMEPILVMCRHRKRHIFEPRAISREAVLPELKDEFRRKVRIMTRCLNSLRLAPEVLNPMRTGWFAVQVISHRLLRWLVPVFALTAFAANLFLLHHPIYRATLLLQALFVAGMLVGWVSDRLRIGPAFLRLPYHFGAANAAALVALGNCLMGRNIVAWGTRRA
jgi:cellulose synthase/poly-beta-1,6-N-acetylglucosamine synthase-like glycosyltransferase